jgi:high-affinity iron transporter
LKRNASETTKAGGYLTLGLTAFLAVYREGAETALLYQALLARQPSGGVMGVFTGLGVGLVLLAILYVVIRRTSVKLPMRRFFQVSGLLLFAMAVVFAGHGVAELQTSRVIKWTGIAWMGEGIPLLGIYPNIQCLTVQGMFLAGAALALVMTTLGADPKVTSVGRSSSSSSKQIQALGTAGTSADTQRSGLLPVSSGS